MSSSLPQAYRKLHERRREIALLSSTASLLSWDQETGMPPKAAAFRAEQLSYLAGKTHQLSTEPEVGAWIAECEAASISSDSKEGANLRGWRRDFDQSSKLPQDHVETLEHTRSLAMNAWKEARSGKDFSVFAPLLEKTFDLARKTADLLGYAKSPYDALVDLYEEGATAESLSPVLSDLGAAVAKVLPAAMASAGGLSRSTLKGTYPVEAQKRFNAKVAEALGYDFARGRIDTVTHPFCGTYGPNDVRLTTRYDEQDFAVSFFGVLHEAGHGLYEQGLPSEEFGQPAGRAASLGIHESQSRTWENKIGRGRPFWEHWFPIACDHFESLRRFDLDTFLKAINAVAPTYIRVEADEVTYDLHVVLRFEIELALLERTLKVADVPHRWNSRFKELTGLAVPDDSLGCLQDVHWSYGLIGYFPTYSLGNLNSSQLWARLRSEQPEIDAELRAGGGASVLNWMRDRIHRHGRCLRPSDLMRRATGESTDARHHVAYLKSKYNA